MRRLPQKIEYATARVIDLISGMDKTGTVDWFAQTVSRCPLES